MAAVGVVGDARVGAENGFEAEGEAVVVVVGAPDGDDVFVATDEGGAEGGIFDALDESALIGGSEIEAVAVVGGGGVGSNVESWGEAAVVGEGEEEGVLRFGVAVLEEEAIPVHHGVVVFGPVVLEEGSVGGGGVPGEDGSVDVKVVGGVERTTVESRVVGNGEEGSAEVEEVEDGAGVVGDGSAVARGGRVVGEGGVAEEGRAAIDGCDCAAVSRAGVVDEGGAVEDEVAIDEEGAAVTGGVTIAKGEGIYGKGRGCGDSKKAFVVLSSLVTGKRKAFLLSSSANFDNSGKRLAR